MAVHGADTADLERLAREFSTAAQRLDAVRSGMSQRLGLPLGWRGPDAERFTQLWNYEASQKLAKASAGLTAAAAALRRNAAEQTTASAIGGTGGAGHTGKSGVTDGEIFSAIGIAGIMGGYLDVFKESRLGEYFGKITSLIGLVDAGQRIDENARDGNAVGALLGGVNLGSAGLGLASKAFGPLSAALGVFTTFVDATIPIDPDDYDGVVAAGARSAFGKNPEDLTEAQRSALNHRYDGPVGVANMISDQMDNTADKVVKFFGNVFGG